MMKVDCRTSAGGFSASDFCFLAAAAVATRGADSLRGKPLPLGLTAGLGAGPAAGALGFWDLDGVESRDELPPALSSPPLPGLGPMAALGLVRPRALGSERGLPVIRLRYTFFPPLTPLSSSESSRCCSVLRSPGFRILAPRRSSGSASAAGSGLVGNGSLKGEPTDFSDSTESESDEAWRESDAAAAFNELTTELAPSWIAFQSNDSESGEAGLCGASAGSGEGVLWGASVREAGLWGASVGEVGLRGASVGSSSARMPSSCRGRGFSKGAGAVGGALAAVGGAEGVAFFFFLGMAELMHSCSRSSSESMDSDDREEFLEKQTGVSSTWKALGT